MRMLFIRISILEIIQIIPPSTLYRDPVGFRAGFQKSLITRTGTETDSFFLCDAEKDAMNTQKHSEIELLIYLGGGINGFAINLAFLFVLNLQ